MRKDVTEQHKETTKLITDNKALYSKAAFIYSNVWPFLWFISWSTCMYGKMYSLHVGNVSFSATYTYIVFSSYISSGIWSLLLFPCFLPASCLLSLRSPFIHPPLSTLQSELQATSFVLFSSSLSGSEVRGPQTALTAAPWCWVLSTGGGFPMLWMCWCLESWSAAKTQPGERNKLAKPD